MRRATIEHLETYEYERVRTDERAGGGTSSASRLWRNITEFCPDLWWKRYSATFVVILGVACIVPGIPLSFYQLFTSNLFDPLNMCVVIVGLVAASCLLGHEMAVGRWCYFCRRRMRDELSETPSADRPKYPAIVTRFPAHPGISLLADVFDAELMRAISLSIAALDVNAAHFSSEELANIASATGLRFRQVLTDSSVRSKTGHSGPLGVQMPVSVEHFIKECKALVVMLAHPQVSWERVEAVSRTTSGEEIMSWALASRPIRRCSSDPKVGAAALDRASEHWTDKTTSAVDSAVFSKQGPWIWPRSKYFFFLMILLNLPQCVYPFQDCDQAFALNNYYNTCTSVSVWTLVGVALHFGKKKEPKVLLLLLALALALEAIYIGITPLFESCSGKIDVHDAGNRDSACFVDIIVGLQIMMMEVLGIVSYCIVPVFYPQHTVNAIGFWATSVLFVLPLMAYSRKYDEYGIRISSARSHSRGYDAAYHMCEAGMRMYTEVTTLGTLPMGAFAAMAWVFTMVKRKIALRVAFRVEEEDAQRYEDVWNEMLRDAETRRAVQQLDDLFHRAMRDASQTPRLQPPELASVGALFAEADRFNPLLQRKFWQLCKDLEGIEHHAAPVKGEARALQKMHRNYEGNHRRLIDLVRTGVVCRDFNVLRRFLELLLADPEIILVKGSMDKNRFAMGYDSIKSGGYRDLQLTAKLVSAEARELGLDTHLCELQLHVEDFQRLKSDGGHKSYIERRNLKGV